MRANWVAMQTTVIHLFEQPQYRLPLAALIHNEFWQEVPGASVACMADRLAQAASAHVIPLCLVALQGGVPIGVVNLVHNDDDKHPEWQPWLAGMVVAAPYRGQGVGSLLVQSLLGAARRLNVERVYLGTDGPGFYQRLGAVVHAVPREGFYFMRFDL